MTQGRFVIPFSQLRMTDVDIVGGKNASLGELLSQLTDAGIQCAGRLCHDGRSVSEPVSEGRRP